MSLHRSLLSPRALARSVAWLVAAAAPVAAQAPAAAGAPQAIPWSEHALTSAILKEERRLLVAVPDGYETPGRSYPLLWLLDADDREQFAAAVANVRFLVSRGAIPPLVVAGIANGADRMRDLTPPPSAAMRAANPTAGGMDRFLDFVEQEARPLVAARYRVAPYTIFAGHSLGGLAGVFVAARRPGMAQAVIAMSPSLWFNEDALIAPWSAAIAGRTAPLRLFSTRGGNEPLIDRSAGRFERRLDSLLARRRARAVAYRHHRYPDDSHNITPLQSLTDGLRFTFAEYSMAVTDIDRLPDPFKADSAQWARALGGVEQQWAARRQAFPAAVLGEAAADDALPESYFAMAPLLASINPGAGEALARRAVALRPQSVAAARVLAEVHAIRGDTASARTRLTEALARARAARDSAGAAAVEGALQKLAGSASKGPGTR